MNQIIIDVTGNHLQAIVPVLILAVFGLLILLLDMFQKGGSRQYLAWVAIAGFAAAFVSAYVLWHSRIPRSIFAEMAYMDGYTQAFTCIFAVAGILTCLLAREYLKSHDMDRGEFYVILLFATLGMIIVASAADMMMMFLGIETMSISAYVLAAFFRKDKRSAEAGLKYLILGALATGLLLYGTALVYGVTGTTNLHEIGRVLSGEAAALSMEAQSVISTETMVEISGDTAAYDVVREHINNLDLVAAAREIDTIRSENPVLPEFRTPVTRAGYLELMPLAFLGMLLILIAFAFKIAAVPFHMWAPDVYEGAPTPVVGFMATAVKAAGFAGLLRVLLLAFFEDASRNSTTGWVQIIFALALLTMVVGNFAAIVQHKLKRMLAYSSIAHAGYILVAVVAAGFANDQTMFASVIFYLVAYTFATIGAFGVLTYFGRRGEEVKTYDDLDGLGQKHPWASFAMVIFMLSAAGIPPTAGFIAKFFVFKSAVDAGIGGGGGTGNLLILLACLGVLASVAGVYYYLKVIVHLYMKDAGARVIRPLVSWATTIALIVCVVGTLFIGLLPSRLSRYSRQAAARIADTAGSPAQPFSDTANDDLQVWHLMDE